MLWKKHLSTLGPPGSSSVEFKKYYAWMVIWLSIPTAIVVQSHLKMLQYTSAGRSKGSNFSNNTLLAVPTFTVKGHLQEGCRKRGITSLRVTILTANKQCATEVEYFDSSSSQTASENLPFYSVLVNTFEQRVTRCSTVTPWCSFWMTRIWPLTGESRLFPTRLSNLLVICMSLLPFHCVLPRQKTAFDS